MNVASAIAMATMVTASAVVAAVQHLGDLVDEAKRGVAILNEILGVLQELVRLHAKPVNYQPMVPDRPSFTRLPQEGEKLKCRFASTIGAVQGRQTSGP